MSTMATTTLGVIEKVTSLAERAVGESPCLLADWAVSTASSTRPDTPMANHITQNMTCPENDISSMAAKSSERNIQ